MWNSLRTDARDGLTATCRADRYEASSAPCSAGIRARWTREVMPSFQKMWRRWNATVCVLRNTRLVTRRSVSVRLFHAVGERAADQQHRPFRIGHSAEQGHLQMLLEVLDVGVDVRFGAHQASSCRRPPVSTVSLAENRGRPHRPARAIPLPRQNNRARTWRVRTRAAPARSAMHVSRPEG
jgi:hypothetical protein